MTPPGAGLPRFTAAMVRGLRGPKSPPDPRRPIAVWDELETAAAGVGVATRVVLLAGAECPFPCAHCDLWRHTLDGPTPPGALPEQLRAALSLEAGPAGAPTWIKLYNASNFSDPRAVPPEDLPTIAALVRGFERVVVETHPRLVDEGLARFAAALGGRLEVAMGLETADPGLLAWIGKGMSREDFAAACARLEAVGIDARAFVLVGLPGLDEPASVAAALEAIAFAVASGVRHVSLVPTRPGNGTLDRLGAEGLFRPVGAAAAEAVLERALGDDPGAIVTLDGWDWGRLEGHCDACRDPRLARIAAMNLSQRVLAPVPRACACPAAGYD